MRLAAAFGLAAVLALTAPASAQIEPFLSGNVVRIGVLTDMSSIYADIGGPGSVEAARMAIADFGGYVNGKKIELLSADHHNKPDFGSAIANQWFGNDGVDVIVDVATSSVALAVQEVAHNRNKVLLISGAAASDLTGRACSPTSVHWTYDTVALANGTGGAVVRSGGDTWFFVTANYAFGLDLERDTAQVVKENGGWVLGSVRAPLMTADFSPFLSQAQSSRAKLIGLANAGGDTINSIKQAAKLGIVAGGQKLAGLLLFISDVHSLGLQTAQGLQLTSGFYWDQNDATRAWSKRFFDRMKREPTMVQAGVYGSIMHYLAAIKASGTDDGPTVVRQMKATPVDDLRGQRGEVHLGPPGVARGRQIVEEGWSVMAGGAEDPAMSARRDIPARPRIGLLDDAGGKDPLLLDQNRAGPVAALFVLPNPRGDVVDRIDNILRAVIADHAVRPLGGIAADRHGRVD
jgi:branched-chain amino acid transport system substrate-binding protein